MKAWVAGMPGRTDLLAVPPKRERDHVAHELVVDQQLIRTAMDGQSSAPRHHIHRQTGRWTDAHGP